MSFFRHREIFRSDMFDWSGGGISAPPGLIGCDEFPAGYSSSDCSPAGSASASPTIDHFALKSSCRSMVFHRTAYSVLTVCLSPGGHPSCIPQKQTRQRLRENSRGTDPLHRSPRRGADSGVLTGSAGEGDFNMNCCSPTNECLYWQW